MKNSIASTSPSSLHVLEIARCTIIQIEVKRGVQSAKFLSSVHSHSLAIVHAS